MWRGGLVLVNLVARSELIYFSWASCRDGVGRRKDSIRTVSSSHGPQSEYCASAPLIFFKIHVIKLGGCWFSCSLSCLFSVCLPACLPADEFLFFFFIAAPFDVSPKCSVVSERLHAMEPDEADRDNEVYITHRQSRQTNTQPGVRVGILPCVARRCAAGLSWCRVHFWCDTREWVRAVKFTA